MKKILFALALAGMLPSMALAQDIEVPTKKHSVATNSFWSNWFISAGVSGNAYYTSQETNFSNNPFTDKRGTLGFTVALGKWFTPGIGLRTKLDGAWGKQVYNESIHPLYTRLNIHEDLMFNLSNMLCGYNEERVWNFIPYVGIGAATKLGDQKNARVYYTCGLLNNFRVSSRWQVFADLHIGAAQGSFDKAANDAWSSYKTGRAHHWDKDLALDLGVTYNIGKHTWSKVPDIDALTAMNQEQMDALNQSLEEQQDENARLRELLAKAKKDQQSVVEKQKEFVGTSASVFFNINSDKVASRKDLVNVKELAEYAKSNNAKLVVTGYADSRTGSAEYNQQLSEKRANAVVNELVKMGVNRDNIVVDAKGGVMNLSPFSYNRRATVKVQ